MSNTGYEELFTFCMECEELLNPDRDSINCVGCCRWVHAACLRIPTEAMESFESIKKYGFLWMCNQCKLRPGTSQNSRHEEIMHADKVVVEMEELVENDDKAVEKINKQMITSHELAPKLVVQIHDFPEKIDGEQTEQQKGLPNFLYVENKKYINCPYHCGKKFSGYSARRYHIAAAHTGEKPFSCEVCDKKFAVKNSLYIHSKIHNKEKTYCCNICDRKFTLPSSLKAHLKTHKKAYRCSWEGCEMKFAQSEQLKQHNLKHTGAPPTFMCHICGQAFFHDRSLKRHHIKIHTTDEKSFSCSTCNKKFSFQTELNRHVRNKHTSAAKPLCNICGTTCADNTCLKVHLQTHSEVKPFSCEICEKRFHRSFSLQEHRRVHTGEKPYSCNVCFKRFSQKHSLTTHMKNVHNASADAGTNEPLLV